MRGGATGLLVCALLWLSAAGVPLEAQENMEGTADAPQVRGAEQEERWRGCSGSATERVDGSYVALRCLVGKCKARRC